MTLLEKLRAHKGGLVRIKTQLCWYDGRGYDGNPGRLCLLLDAADANIVTAAATAASRSASAGALLLIDGAPRWVWVAAEDIELLDGGDR